MGSREDSRSRSESESDDSDRSSTESTNEQEEGERSPTPQKKSKKSKSHKKVFSDPIKPAHVRSEIFKLNSISGPLRTGPRIPGNLVDNVSFRKPALFCFVPRHLNV